MSNVVFFLYLQEKIACYNSLSLSNSLSRNRSEVLTPVDDYHLISVFLHLDCSSISLEYHIKARMIRETWVLPPSTSFIQGLHWRQSVGLLDCRVVLNLYSKVYYRKFSQTRPQKKLSAPPFRITQCACLSSCQLSCFTSVSHSVCELGLNL